MTMATSSPNPGGTMPPPHEVLLVDDNTALLDSLADAIADRDIAPIPVSDPREALNLARQRPFAAAVVDLIMPGMDGLELARELHKANPRTEVILLTGHADMQSAVQAIRVEVFDFLQKDALHPARLRRSVRAAIARSELEAENLRLADKVRESAERLRGLCDLSSRLAQVRGVNALLTELADASRRLLGAEASRVLLLQPIESGGWLVRAGCGSGRTPSGRLGPNEGLVSQVIRTASPMNLVHPAEHPGWAPRCDELGTRRPGFLCVPLHGVEDGVLMVAGRERAFGEDDVAVLASVAHQGAMALAAAAARNRFPEVDDESARS